MDLSPARAKCSYCALHGAAVVLSVLLCTPLGLRGGFCQAVSALGGCHCHSAQMTGHPEQWEGSKLPASAPTAVS